MAVGVTSPNSHMVQTHNWNDSDLREPLTHRTAQCSAHLDQSLTSPTYSLCAQNCLLSFALL